MTSGWQSFLLVEVLGDSLLAVSHLVGIWKRKLVECSTFQISFSVAENIQLDIIQPAFVY
jgi:hypothetical protein